MVCFFQAYLAYKQYTMGAGALSTKTLSFRPKSFTPIAYIYENAYIGVTINFIV